MSKLFFGCGKKDITPDPKDFDNLFDLGKKPFSQIHDRIYVRTMCFSIDQEKTLLVSFDLDKAPYPDQWVGMLSELTGIPESSILYIGIHCHSVPVTGYRPFEPYHDVSKASVEVQATFRKYEAFVKEQLIASALQAVSDKREAQLSFGMQKCFLNVNRISSYQRKDQDGKTINVCCEMPCADRPVDQNVRVMCIKDLQGNLMGLFINYAIHGVMMFGASDQTGKTRVSGDIGGNVSQRLEEAFPGCLAMWSSGPAGDVNPILRNQLGYPDPKDGKFIRERRLSDYDDSALLLDFVVAHHVHAVKAAISNSQICQAQKVFSNVVFSDTPSRIAGDNKPYRIRLHLLQIGDVAIIGINGELYSSHGFRMQAESLSKNTIIVNHDSSLVLDNPCYIYDDQTITWWENADECTIPGRADFRGVKGYIENSLAEATKRLFEISSCNR